MLLLGGKVSYADEVSFLCSSPERLLHSNGL